MDINLNVKLYLEDEHEKFMGIGVLWLLQAIDRNHSLRAAAAEMGISYSKAYTMIQRLEEALDQKILDRKKGGQDRAGAVLTPFAKELIVLYDGFQKSCKGLLDKPFNKFQKNLNKLIARTNR